MSPRHKLIILVALLVLLGIVAYFQLLGRSKEPARTESARPAPQTTTAPATETTTAPAGADEAKPADMAQDSERSAAELRELANWLDVLGPTGAGVTRGGAPVFGISTKTPYAASDATPQDPTQISWMPEPGKLDAIVKVGNGPGKALFQGELYQVGDKVRGTSFTIVAVEDDFVTLKSGNRVIRRFWHE
jgi:hypothetical protein